MIRSIDTNLVSKTLNWDVFKNRKKKIEKEKYKLKKKKSSTLKGIKSPASRHKNVRFLDSLDCENLQNFRTERDVW